MEKKYALDLGFVMAKYGKKRIESQVRDDKSVKSVDLSILIRVFIDNLSLVINLYTS
jgi:hypothetical protein